MTRPGRALWQGLATDRRGATIVEFALVAPMFLVLLFGLLDAGQMIYAKSILTGAVQRAGRDAALEMRDTAQIDTKVFNLVHGVLPGITRNDMTATRTSYSDYSDVGRPEAWNDANGNGICDNNETYVDENRSGQWEADVGRTGSAGTANDVVVYAVEVRFRPLFEVPLLPAFWGERTLSARTMIRNQPFGNQADYGSTTGSCP